LAYIALFRDFEVSRVLELLVLVAVVSQQEQQLQLILLLFQPQVVQVHKIQPLLLEVL
jgi:hypothetical protein